MANWAARSAVWTAAPRRSSHRSRLLQLLIAARVTPTVSAIADFLNPDAYISKALARLTRFWLPLGRPISLTPRDTLDNSPQPESLT